MSENERCPLERMLDAACGISYISIMDLLIQNIMIALSGKFFKCDQKIKTGREACVLMYALTCYASKRQCFAQ